MNFESLSSEVFFDIFDFLADVGILHGFYNLNSRFNNLLFTYFRVSPQLNLQSISKTDFDISCEYFIPLITDQIHSLHLSNDDHTPQQIDLFFSYGLTLSQFPSLKSLSLHHIHSEQIINRMMIEWQYPVHLTHLNLTGCRILNQWNIVYSLINNIWSLSKLTHCHLDIGVIDQRYSIVPSVVSTTLECLSIKNMRCNLEELINLFEHTPRLRYLDIIITEKNINHSHLSFSMPLMTTFKLTYKGSLDVLENLLKNVPNLHHWTMRIQDIYVEGQQWEGIISNHLSKLQVFHLLMKYSQNSFFWTNILIDTYKSDFWLKKHKWYVQSHCYYQKSHQTLFLYTLPYTFNDYRMPLNDTNTRSKSSFPNLIGQIPYDHVHHLLCDSFPRYDFPYEFSHLHHLVIKFPFHNNFWTLIPTVDQLRILDISLSHTEAYNTDISCRLQTLLAHAPKLHSLTFDSSIESVLPLLECTSESIIKLDFQSCDGYFNQSQCAALFLSSLGKQCQILSIKVDNRMNILQLVNEIPQLQTLNIKHPPNQYKSDFLSFNNDKLIRWLQRQLPSTCTITRDSTELNKIQIWIR